MNEITILLLSVITLCLVGAYVYKKEMAPKPPPKVEVKFYNYNF